MKRSMFSQREMSSRRVFLAAFMLVAALCFAFILTSSSAANAEGIGGTAYSSEYTSQEEAYDAANDLNELLVEEGIVLLKNDGNALPLATGSKINVFGKNSANIAIGGTGSSTGSGSVEATKAVSLYDSLENAGFELNPELKAFYEDNSLSGPGRPSPNMGTYLNGLSTGETPPESYSEALKATYADYDDASIVVITRIGGEGYDLPLTMLSGGNPMAGSEAGDHYLELDLYEEAIFASLEADSTVSNVIVIVNASQQMELGFLFDSVNYSKVKAAIWVGGPGQAGVAAIGRVLNGEVNPSGHLVDTYAADFKQDPVWFNFGNSNNQGKYGTIVQQQATDPVTGDPLVDPETQEPIMIDVFQGGNVNYVDYEEGIYLGYRYWETAGFDKNDSWAWYDENVVFPLGYGLSYTSFTWEIVGTPTIPSPLAVDSEVEVTVKVTNTGSVAGKDVVQLYYTAPYYNGGIEKSYVRLADFAKTPLLEPAASANVTMSVTLKDLAAYDYSDANNNGFKGYELEAGDYTFRVLKNANARSVNGVADFTMTVPVVPEDTATNGATGIKFTHDEVTGTEIKNLFDDVSQKAINGTLEDKAVAAVRDSGGFMNVMTRATEDGGLAGTIPTAYPSNERRTVSQTFLSSYSTPNNTDARIAADEGKPWYKTEMPTQAEDELGEVTVFLKDLIGVAIDDPMWDTFMNQMTYEEMGYLIGHGAFHTMPIERLGKPWSIEVDGPVGLVPRQAVGPLMHLNDFVSCVYATEPVVAATWNKDLVFEYGEMTGEESIWGNTEYAYSGIYAPGLNIHRSPFSGRNFEYYSEDGVLSGKMAAAFCGGAQSKGLYTMMKHYVLNDQETNRSGVHTWADEQTMREIYFLPYEKAIKDGNSRGAMAAYNSIGKTWTGNSYALMIDLTRNEWGFDGMIITDWGGFSANTQSWMVRTGVDLFLGGSGEGTLPFEGADLTPTYAWALRRAAKAIMFTVANSNAMIPRLSYADANLTPDNFLGTVPYTMDVSGAKPNYELDEPLAITYSAVGLPSQLTLDPVTGIITGTLPKGASGWRPVPYSYTFTITATVPEGSTINSSVVAEYTIEQATLTEVPMLATGKVGQAYYNDALAFALPAPYEDAAVTFKLDPGLKYGTWVIRPASPALPDGLVLNADGTITGTPTVATEAPINVIIIASSLGVDDVTITRSISVAPADPALAFENVALANGEVGTEYSAALVATGADTITFASDDVPAGLVLDPNGAITGTPTAAGIYMFSVTASAEGFDSVSAIVTVEIAEEVIVVPPAIVFNNALLSAGQVGSAYSATLVASGAEGITFASEDLPAGLVLNANGSISGTPTAAGTYLFTVTASADGATSADASIAISIAEEDEVVLPNIVFNDVMLAAGQVGSAYSATLTATGATGITFASDDLPAGLVLNANGSISGTPTTAGTYMFTVTASATGAIAADASITISVAEEDEVVLPAITFNDALLTAGQVGSAYSATLTATGATGITFASDDLPAGLTLNANGSISGTPTAAGTYLFVVTASATGAQPAEAAIAINVAAEAGTTLPAITFNDTLLTAGTVGTAYSGALTATGATGITFASDDLPAGLTLNADGTISGTPTEAGVYLFSVTASATGAQSAVASVALHIASDVVDVTGCGSALTVSTIIMSLLTAMVAGVFIFLRKRH